MLEIAERVAEVEPDTLVLADTIGVAAPTRGAIAHTTRRRARHRRSGGHFHNTRNTGYANALAALEAGATVLDASSAASAAVPFAPNATGNIATEDLVYALEREGVETGIDLDRLIETIEWLAETARRRLEGQLYRAGRFPPAPGSSSAARGQDRPRAPRRARARPARPRSTTSSSSSRNVRVEPSASPIGCSPFRVSSMSEPSLPVLGPEIVPEAKRSPVAIDAPFTVACASCCGIVQ